MTTTIVWLKPMMIFLTLLTNNKMASNQQNITGLLLAKREQVKALQDLGFADISESSRASLFAERIRWAAGLLDIRVAADRKRDGKKFYFTVEEWQTIDNAGRSEEFARRGVRIRADGLSFVMSLQYYADKTWGSRSSVSDLASFDGRAGAWSHQDVARFNQAILDYYADKNADGVIGAPAAEAANGYHAYLEDDGVMVNGVAIDDQTSWMLPDVAQAFVIYHNRKAIDTVIAQVWGHAFTLDKTGGVIWTCVQVNGSVAYRVSVLSGNVYGTNKTDKYMVIPISEE